MTSFERIETLGYIGGIGVIVSPFLKGIFSIQIKWFYPAILYNYIFFLMLIIFGIIAGTLTLRAVGVVRKIPHRAINDLIIAGILIVIPSLLSIALLSLFFGLAILITGIEAEALWNNIRYARRKTGFPYVTVATAAGNEWARRLSCQFCGAPLVIKSAKAHGPWIHMICRCPLDKISEVIRLPLAYLESWVSTVADRLHRCEICGERTVGLIVTRQRVFNTTLQAFCSKNHRNVSYRKIWTPLYPHVARSPKIDPGFHSGAAVPPSVPSIQVKYARGISPGRAGIYTQITPISISTARSIPLHTSSTTTPIRDRQIRFCGQCGFKIGQSDRFCYRCGSRIQ